MYKIVVEYLKNNKRVIINNSNEDIEILYQEENIINGKNISLSLKGNNIVLLNVIVAKDYKINKDSRLYVNGFQSWTDSREFLVNEKLKSLNKLPKKLVSNYAFDMYGDAYFKKYYDKKGDLHGYTYGYVRDNDSIKLIGSINDYNFYSIINYSYCRQKLFIESNVNGYVINGEVKVLDFIEIENSIDVVFDQYKNYFKPRKAKEIKGYTSWYNYYQDINEEKIYTNLKAIASTDNELFQIDDGYQTFVGDFLSVNQEKFPNGLKPIVDQIHADGLKAGIWMAPFIAEEKSETFKLHPDWFLKDHKGNFIKAGSNWSSFYALDFYNDEARAYIEQCLRFMIEENKFDLLKLDFLYAVCLKPRKDKSRAMIMRESLEFIRQIVGDKVLILGCGVPLISGAEIFDYCRIGPDVSLIFDDIWYMKYMHRERISTKVNVMNTIYRRQINDMWFKNDPDVFLLRKDNISLNEKQKYALCVINHLFGKVWLTSDNVSLYEENELNLYNNANKYIDKKVKDVIFSKNKKVEIILDDETLIYDYLKGEFING